MKQRPRKKQDAIKMTDLNPMYTKLSGYYDLTHYFRDYQH